MSGDSQNLQGLYLAFRLGLRHNQFCRFPNAMGLAFPKVEIRRVVGHERALWKLTAPWTHRTRRPRLGERCAFFHELRQDLSHPITHEEPRKAPKYRWETRIDPSRSARPADGALFKSITPLPTRTVEAIRDLRSR